MLTIMLLSVLVNICLIIAVVVLACTNHKLSSELKDVGDADLWQTLAYKDNLTGLYNRTAYSKHISEIEKSDNKENYMIIVFDIDKFKAINDTRGHVAGDAVLQFVAETLLLVFPTPVYEVYRIGGDEFVVIANRVVEAEISASLDKLNNILEEEGDIRVSSGFSAIRNTFTTGFINADKNLYINKASKNNQ